MFSVLEIVMLRFPRFHRRLDVASCLFSLHTNVTDSEAHILWQPIKGDYYVIQNASLFISIDAKSLSLNGLFMIPPKVFEESASKKRYLRTSHAHFSDISPSSRTRLADTHVTCPITHHFSSVINIISYMRSYTHIRLLAIFTSDIVNKVKDLRRMMYRRTSSKAILLPITNIHLYCTM